MTRLIAAAVLMAVLMAGIVHANEGDADAVLIAAVQRALQQIADRHGQTMLDAATKATLPGVTQVHYPPGTNLFIQILSSAAFDGINHLVLGIHPTTLEMFAFSLTPDGTPNATVERPFIHGTLASFKQTGPTTFLVSWNVSTSSGGLFIPEGAGFLIEITI